MIANSDRSFATEDSITAASLVGFALDLDKTMRNAVGKRVRETLGRMIATVAKKVAYTLGAYAFAAQKLGKCCSINHHMDPLGPRILPRMGKCEK